MALRQMQFLRLSAVPNTWNGAVQRIRVPQASGTKYLLSFISNTIGAVPADYKTTKILEADFRMDFEITNAGIDVVWLIIRVL
jgi:hypothetical protein